MVNRLARFLKAGALALALTPPALAAQPGPPAPGGFRLPANYLSRFSTTELLASNEVGFGVRYFPLPLDPDIRVTLAKQPNYWEYNLSTRVNDTTFSAGIFDNGALASAGIPRLEVTRDPFRGVQYSARLQGGAAYSRFTGGYAFALAGDRVRVLNNVGVAYDRQGGDREVVAPYTQSEVVAGYVRSFGRLNTYVGATARAFTFPVQREAQGSFDLYVSANITPARGLILDGSHLERLAVGTVPVDDLYYGRYQESNFNVTYRLPVAGTPAFTLGAVRARVNRRWTEDYTAVRGDLLFRVEALPSLVGPSIGYQWSRDSSQTKWLLSLSFLPR